MLGILKSTCFVTVALNVSNKGKVVLDSIFIPPVQVGYNAMRCAYIWDSIIKSIRTLQLQHHIDAENQVLIRDFGAHIGQNRADNLPSDTALSRKCGSYKVF